jgi:hypothetical protein
MHKKFYFCPGIFLLLASAMIFLISFSLESSIETKARSVVVDDLGNIYLLHETFIERRSTAGKESFRSSDFNYGSPRCLDITNPLKPFLHFPESGKIILFDNTLSQQGDPVDLFNQSLGQIEIIAGSRGDAYWLWDAMNSEMIRTDHNFQKLFSSGNLSVLLHKELHPNQILERGDHVYLVDPVHGVIVFDIYGSYRTTLKIFPLFDLQSVNNQLIFMESAEIHVLSNDWISSELIEIPANNVNGLTYFNKKFYLLRNGFLEVWKE